MSNPLQVILKRSARQLQMSPIVRWRTGHIGGFPSTYSIGNYYWLITTIALHNIKDRPNMLGGDVFCGGHPSNA